MKKAGAKSKATLCPKGLHPMNRENTYVHPTKGPECRDCKREYMRDYMRGARARAARAAKKASKAKARGR